jgi:hypothetical protein
MPQDTKNDEPSVVVDETLLAEGEAAEQAETATATETATDEEPEVTTTEATEEEAAEVEQAVAEENQSEGDTTERLEVTPEDLVQPDTDAEPDDWQEREREAEQLLNNEPLPAPGQTGPDERKWPQWIALGLIGLVIFVLLAAVALGTAECTGADGGGADISKVVPNRTPEPPAPNKAVTPPPAPNKARPNPVPAKVVTPTPPAPTPTGNVTGVVDQTLEAVNVNATSCRTRVQLVEQGSKVILRTTYSCPPAAINLVTGSE